MATPEAPIFAHKCLGLPGQKAAEVFFFFFFCIFYWFCYYSCTIFPPLSASTLQPPPTSIAHSPFSSRLWVIHRSSLASPFSILFLTSPCLFCIYQLCFLFPVPFLPFAPFPLPADNPPRDLHFCDSFPVVVVCLVCCCFFRFSWR